MAKKTLTQQLEEAKARISELESKVGENKPFDIHEGLDACLDYLNKNSFYTRGINSDGITALVRSAREKLRIATKK